MKTSPPRVSVDRLLALVALVCAAAALLLRNASPPPATAELQPIRDELARLTHLVGEAMKARDHQPAAASAPAGETVSQDGVTIRQVHEWAWGLEQRLVQLEHHLADALPGGNTSAEPPADVAQARQAALNVNASAEERLAALRTLRTADARSSEIVQAMLQLQANSQDPAVRADIFRQLSGVKDATLKPPLINALLKDAHPKVREEAAETMAPFLADPYIRSALASAAQNDIDEKVKAQARETLEAHRER
jgi:hypothetical protein